MLDDNLVRNDVQSLEPIPEDELESAGDDILEHVLELVYDDNLALEMVNDEQPQDEVLEAGDKFPCDELIPEPDVHRDVV